MNFAVKAGTAMAHGGPIMTATAGLSGAFSGVVAQRIVTGVTGRIVTHAAGRALAGTVLGGVAGGIAFTAAFWLTPIAVMATVETAKRIKR